MKTLIRMYFGGFVLKVEPESNCAGLVIFRATTKPLTREEMTQLRRAIQAHDALQGVEVRSGEDAEVIK